MRCSPRYKKQKQTPQYSQKNDSGASGIQNNAPNYGQMAGHDVNNFGIIPRTINEANFVRFFAAYPDKNTRLVFSFYGSPDGEMLNAKNQIIQILKKNGYSNIGLLSGYAIPQVMPKNITYVPQPDGSVIWWVPPPQD